MALKDNLLKMLDETHARLSVEEIATFVGADPETVALALGEMEADKTICGYNAIIDWDRIGEEKVIALIEVKVAPQRGVGFDRIAMRIAKYEEVSSVYLISGGFDFLVELRGKSMKEVSQFVFDKLSTLDSVVSTATHFVLKKYKDHSVIVGGKEMVVREKVVL